MFKADGELNVIFNKLFVNSVDSGAGIFIGNNTAYGWSSIRKENSGFGSARGGTIHHNCNVVYDNDQVDFPVREQDVYIHRQTSPASQNITFQTIDVNAVTVNSTVSVGENNQAGWKSSGKNNMGDGRLKGINIVHNNVNTVMDEDVIDSPLEQNSAAIAAQAADGILY